MLVLSRKQGEQICIGEGVVVTVIEVHGGRVQIGIQAPREISVDRQEIRQRKIEEGSEMQSQRQYPITEVA